MDPDFRFRIEQLRQARLEELRTRRTAVQLPSEESGGKPSHDADFKAGYAAGKAAYEKNDRVSKVDAEKAYKKLSRKHGSWWVDGYTAAIDLARGAYATKPAQIAKKLKIASSAGYEFSRMVNKALDQLKDAIDVAELRDPHAMSYESGGSLADSNTQVAQAINLIRKFSAHIDPMLRRIR